MAGEWALMLGFKNKFNVDHSRSENHAFYNVVVSGERSGKWHSELIADGFLPLHEQARNLKHYIFRVVRHNAIQVRSSPRVVVFMDERFDVKARCNVRLFALRIGCELFGAAHAWADSMLEARSYPVVRIHAQFLEAGRRRALRAREYGKEGCGGVLRPPAPAQHAIAVARQFLAPE